MDLFFKLTLKYKTTMKEQRAINNQVTQEVITDLVTSENFCKRMTNELGDVMQHVLIGDLEIPQVRESVLLTLAECRTYFTDTIELVAKLKTAPSPTETDS